VKDIIIEKPFVINKKTITKYSNLNIVMVENCLYSRLPKLIKQYLDDNKKEANLSIFYDGKLIKNELISVDDNFTYFIEEAYNYFHNKSANPNIISIDSFSSIMKLYCENLLNRKNKLVSEK
jgi:hypothetical protein